jgi:hypothetical protein
MPQNINHEGDFRASEQEKPGNFNDPRDKV